MAIHCPFYRNPIHDFAGTLGEQVRTSWRLRGNERVAPLRPTDAINRVPTSHAMNCARKMMASVSARSRTRSNSKMTGERRMKCMHVLYKKIPIYRESSRDPIYRVRRGGAVVRTKFASRVSAEVYTSSGVVHLRRMAFHSLRPPSN